MEQLRKAAQAMCQWRHTPPGSAPKLHECIDALEDALAAPYLAASQSAEIAEPAPDLPLLQHVVEVCPTLAGSGLVIALHMWAYTYGHKCYAAGLAAKRVVLEAALKASDAMLNEYIDKLRALESKRAPMTLSACGTLYAKHLKFGGPDYAAIQAIREASSGLTLAQAREMALGCVKHPLVFESGDQELDQAFLDGQQWMRSSVLAAIESAFKEPNT